MTQVLNGLKINYQLQGTYQPRDYCVQYRESDFTFASRLMEEEGIYYYFKHSDGSHELEVSDTELKHPDLSGPSPIIYEEIVGGRTPEERVTAWEKTQELRSGKYTLWDHSFELPGKHLEAEQIVVESVAVGMAKHKLKVAGNDLLEVYDYPGGYAQRFDGVDKGGGNQPAKLNKVFEDNKRTVKIRMEQEAMQGLEIRGESTCEQFTVPGISSR